MSEREYEQELKKLRRDFINTLRTEMSGDNPGKALDVCERFLHRAGYVALEVKNLDAAKDFLDGLPTFDPEEANS